VYILTYIGDECNLSFFRRDKYNLLLILSWNRLI